MWRKVIHCPAVEKGAKEEASPVAKTPVESGRENICLPQKRGEGAKEKVANLREEKCITVDENENFYFLLLSHFFLLLPTNIAKKIVLERKMQLLSEAGGADEMEAAKRAVKCKSQKMKRQKSRGKESAQVLHSKNISSLQEATPGYIKKALASRSPRHTQKRELFFFRIWPRVLFYCLGPGKKKKKKRKVVASQLKVMISRNVYQLFFLLSFFLPPSKLCVRKTDEGRLRAGPGPFLRSIPIRSSEWFWSVRTPYFCPPPPSFSLQRIGLKRMFNILKLSPTLDTLWGNSCLGKFISSLKKMKAKKMMTTVGNS